MSLPLLGAGMATDGPSAVLDLNFASLLSLTPSVGPTPSYTRASTGTYFNASGVLTTAAINGPRFDHVYNGSSWVSKGLLIEEARTNSVSYSEDISNPDWFPNDVTISTNFSNAPDGTTNADKITETATSNNHRFYKTSGLSLSSAYTFSVYAKAVSGNGLISIVVGNASYVNAVYARFNLNTGAYSGLTVNGTVTNASASIVSVGNGWYRCAITGTLPAATYYPELDMWDGAASGPTPSYMGSTNNAVLIWGFQLEAGAFPTSYIPTTSAAVTRSADVCQITGGGFSGLWNLLAGTIVVDGDSAVGPSVTGGAFMFWSVDGTPTIEYYYRGGDTLLVVDNVTRKNVIAIPAANTRLNTAIAFTASDFAASVNGASVTTSSNLTMPVTPTVFSVGSYLSAGNQQICGHIARLRYFNTRLTNSQLVALST
jgi:hypothetical protein